MVDRTGILPKSPLVLSLASVRFAPWPLIGKRIDEIHDELREDLPLLQHFQVQTVGPNGAPQSETASLWMLMSGDRMQGVQLSQDQILLTSRKYTRYSDFSALIDKVLTAVLSRMKFMDVTNLGVRYVDHVKVRDGEKLEKYLCPGLLAPVFDGLQRIGGSFGGSYSLENKELRVKCIAQPGAMSLPEDLIPWLAMTLPPNKPLQLRTLTSGECILDMDSVEQHDLPVRVIDKAVVLEKLNSLHNIANAFFRRDDVFTPHAFEIWKSEA